MRVLIADDEELVRYSVRDMLGEISIPVTVVAEAGNGRELVEQCRKLRPDLAIVDIRMPALGGLEAIEQVRDEVPDTEWLILTSYSEFEYARQALNIGAAEYLLKPVSPDELEVALRRTEERRAKRLSATNEAFENRVNSIVDRIPAEVDQTDDWSCAAVLVVGDSRSSAEGVEEFRSKARRLVRQEVSDLISPNSRIAVVRLPGEGFVGILGWRPDELPRGTSTSLKERFESRFGRCSQRLPVQSSALTVITSEPVASLSELSATIDQARRLCQLRPVCGFGRVTSVEELGGVAAIPAAGALAARLTAAATAWAERRPLGLDQAVREAAMVCERHPELRVPEIQRAVERYLATLVSEKARPLDGYATWLPHLVEALLSERRTEHGQLGSGEAVDQVLRYVDENFAADANIAHIARLLGLTPNYLSALFHKQVGRTFTKHLSRVRMDKARELLVRSNLTVADVAVEVGYSSTRHFTRTFKNTFDLYPSDLRRDSGQRSTEAK